MNSYQKNQIIFKEGDSESWMCEIRSGKVGIYKAYGTANQKQLAVLGPDEIFGEMGVLEDAPRSATAVAMEDDTTVNRISTDGFIHYMQEKPVKTFLMMRQMSARLRETTNNYMNACRTISEIADAEDIDRIRDSKIAQDMLFYQNVYHNFGWMH